MSEPISDVEDRHPLDWYPDEEMPAAVQVMLAADGQIPPGGTMKLSIAQIMVSDGRRALGDISALSDSIREVGLINPITVTGDYRLIAGYHRLEACRRLGWAEIPATVCDLDALHAELAEIDENLIRTELSVLDRSEQLARRKVIYEALHPETKRGGDQRSESARSKRNDFVSFAKDTAEKVQVTERTVQQEIQIATSLASDVKEAIRDTPLADNKTALMTLAKKTPEVQRAMIAAADLSHPKAIEQAVHKIRTEEKQAKAAEQIKETPQVDVCLAVGDATALPLRDGSINVVLTSPPYGLEKAYHGQDDLAESWESFMRDWLREAYRVTSAPGRLILNVPLDTTKGGYRPTWPQACATAVAAGWTYRTAIIWDKANSTKGNRGLGSENSADAPHPIAEVEVIGLFSKGPWKFAEARPSDIAPEDWQAWGNGLWRLPGESRGWEGHPAPFPEELVRRLMLYFTRVGDVVLDPFVGSGTTSLVAWRHKRVLIGFDLSKEYVASARRRIAREQGKLQSEVEEAARSDPGLFAGASG